MKKTTKMPAFLKNLSGGTMCSMSDGANFGPVSGTGRATTPKFLTNLSGGAMCSMSDGANFGPVTATA